MEWKPKWTAGNFLLLEIKAVWLSSFHKAMDYGFPLVTGLLWPIKSWCSIVFNKHAPKPVDWNEHLFLIYGAWIRYRSFGWAGLGWAVGLASVSGLFHMLSLWDPYWMSHGHLGNPLLMGDLETWEGKLRHVLHLEDSVHSYPTLLPTYVPIVNVSHGRSHGQTPNPKVWK